MKTIEHSGVVKAVQGDCIDVEIVRSSACGSCEANGSCGVEKENHIVRITDPEISVAVGDEVIVIMEESAGVRAVLLSYILPLIIFIVALIGMSLVTHHEALNGLVAIAVVVPYYLILWFLRDRLRKSFTFRLRNPE